MAEPGGNDTPGEGQEWRWRRGHRGAKDWRPRAACPSAPGLEVLGMHGKIGQSREGPAGILDLSPGSGGSERRAKLPLHSPGGGWSAGIPKAETREEGVAQEETVP